MSATASVPLRLEKLRFLVEEMELAFALSRAAPDAWEARTIARHVLVRARDFIDHARGLRRFVRTAGTDEPFHSLKETFAGWFAEYFAVSRDRLSAHVQDLDFGRRIELWNDIETSKTEVFVDGARQIYGALAAASLPGYLPLSDLAEATELSFRQALAAFSMEEASSGTQVSSDPLALTRPRTTSMLNGHPLHERAGQLVLIEGWVKRGLSDVKRFAAFPRVVRILRARLLTDIVSFADCLVTRRVSASAPQHMKGLEELLRDEGQPSACLTMLVTRFKFEEVIDRLRPQRNRFAAHLEIDDINSLSDLLAAFDGLDWPAVEAVFETLDAAFRKACWEVFILRVHLVSGQTLRGVITGSRDSLVPYDVAVVQPAAAGLPPRASSLTRDDYRTAVASWLRGGAVEADDAGALIWDGFALSEGEPFTLEHEIGAGRRYEQHVWTAAHDAVLEALLSSPPTDALRLLELLARQRSGWPDRAAEVLLRFINTGPEAGLALAAPLCRVLGELASWHAPRHTDQLCSLAEPNRPWPIRREALLALFKTLVRTEGLSRINNRVVRVDYDEAFAPHIADLTGGKELEVLLAMASAFHTTLDIDRKPFAAELGAITQRLKRAAEAFLAQRGREGRTFLIDTLLASEDHVGLVLLLAEGHLTQETTILLDRVRDGAISPARHDQAARHLVSCLWRLEDRQEALEVAARLALQNPIDVQDQLLRLEIQAELGRSLEAVAADAARLRADFLLDAGEEARLATLKTELWARNPVGGSG